MRTERPVWAAIVLVCVVATLAVPLGVALVAAILGGLASLLAVGLILAYRAHRFINIAHASLGAVAGSVVTDLVARWGWNFWLAYPVGLAVGAVLGLIAGLILAERLADASRTVVLVASVGLAFVLGAAHVALGLATGAALSFEVPIPVEIEVFPIRLSGTHLLAVITTIVAVTLLWRFFHRSAIGLRIRALGGNPTHARRLGIDAHATWRLLWVALGVLAAAAGIVTQPLLGTTLSDGPLLGPMLLALAAAAVAGMESIALAVGASVALGIAYQAVLWHVPVAATADAMLFVVVAAAFTMRSRTFRTTDRDDPAQWRFIRSLRPVLQRYSRFAHIGRIALAVNTCVIVLLLVSTLGPGDAQRVGVVAVFAVAALSIHVAATYGGRVPLGQWALVGIGAIIATAIGPSTILGVLAALAGTAVASILLTTIALHGGATAYAAVTFAAAAALPAIIAIAPAGSPDAITIGPLLLDEPEPTTVAIVVIAGFAGLCIAYLRRSKLGRSALAVREDPRAAFVHGVGVHTTTIAIDAISGAIAGLAGVLYLWSQRVVHPDAFDAARSLELVAVAVFGGIGSVLGPFVGAGAVKGPELFARGPLALLATGTGLLIVVLWLRGGLVSLIDLVRARVTEGVARGASSENRSAERAPFGPAPAAETRKARSYRSVRYSGSIALACGTIGGLVAVARLPLDRPLEVVWLGAAGLVALALGTWAGWSRPAIVPAAIVATVAAFGALAVADAAFVTLVAASYAFGGAIRLSASSVGQPLVAAARGWSTVQLVAGVAIGGVIGFWSTEPRSWTIAVALLLLAVVVFSPVVEPPSSSAPADDAALRVRSLSLRVGGTPLLAGVDFAISSGQIIGIVGANGTGKSTLLRCVAAEITPDAGSVSVHGVDTTMLSADELARTSFLLCDAEPGSNGELTVAENLRLAAGASHDPSVIDDVVGAVAAIHPSLVARFDDPAAVLSGGERRILATAQALIIQPRVLLADELARGLTGQSLEVYRAAMRTLAERGTAVVVVDHANEGVEAIADLILTLEGGTLRAAQVQPC